GLAVVPWGALLLMPVLARLSDREPPVRQAATRCFGQLLRLMPLAADARDPPDMAPDLVARKRDEHRFVAQLLGGEPIDKYELPIAIQAELRRYQQEGVNWLAFLRRYGLHGIL